MNKIDFLTKLSRYTDRELDLYRRYYLKTDPERLPLLDDYPSVREEEVLCFHGDSQQTSMYLGSRTVLFSEANKGRGISIFQQDRYCSAVPHKHDFYELIYLYNGEIQLSVEGSSLLMGTGDLCLLSPDCYHGIDSAGNSICLVIQFHKDFLREVLIQLMGGSNILADFFVDHTYAQRVYDYILFHTGADPELQELMIQMSLLELEGGSYSLSLQKIYLLTLFCQLLRRYQDASLCHSRKKKKDQQDYDILRYIDENYKTVSLPELSEKFHFSGHYISQRIRILTGESFMDYLQSKRMQHAVEMLTGTNIKIKDISSSLGYNNQEHFIRTFRKYFNQTPTQYRNIHFKG